jgi:4-hydroxy-tetrahydrodipicolinate reductase
MRALLVGYGKMGRAIEAALAQRGHGVAGRIDERNRPEDFLEGESGGAKGLSVSDRTPSAGEREGLPSPSNDSGPIDVAFEFTTPEAAPRVVPFLLSKKIPVVCGTTGWDVAPAVRCAREKKVPFLHSPNFSVGVAVMRRLAAHAAELLAPFPAFEPGILERHHSAKKDAPSGTAKALAARVSQASAGRDVPVVSLRQGGVPGEHVLYFEGADETLEIVHRARSRAIFAEGAVAAAEWLLESGPPGPATFDEFLDAVTRRLAEGRS